MKVKCMYLMEMVITQFEQMMDYLTLTRAGPYIPLQWPRVVVVHNNQTATVSQ